MTASVAGEFQFSCTLNINYPPVATGIFSLGSLYHIVLGIMLLRVRLAYALASKVTSKLFSETRSASKFDVFTKDP